MKSLAEIKNIKNLEEQARALDERKRELIRRSSHDYVAGLEWDSIKSQEEWEKAQKSAIEDFLSGKFFANKIGRLRNTDPQLLAVILYLRKRWIIEYELKTAPELLLLDFALMCYFHILRLNSLSGNLTWIAELEFFETKHPLKYDRHGYPTGFKSEERLKELSEKIMPLVDTIHRMFLRNLKGMRDLKRSNVVLNIGQVNQMNLGEKQVNLTKEKV